MRCAGWSRRKVKCELSAKSEHELKRHGGSYRGMGMGELLRVQTRILLRLKRGGVCDYRRTTGKNWVLMSEPG